MELMIKVWDEWGGELEAFCTLVDHEDALWRVVLTSRRGRRGALDVTATEATLEQAIHEAMTKAGIHATNNPGA